MVLGIIPKDWMNCNLIFKCFLSTMSMDPACVLSNASDAFGRDVHIAKHHFVEL